MGARPVNKHRLCDNYVYASHTHRLQYVRENTCGRWESHQTPTMRQLCVCPRVRERIPDMLGCSTLERINTCGRWESHQTLAMRQLTMCVSARARENSRHVRLQYVRENSRHVRLQYVRENSRHVRLQYVRGRIPDMLGCSTCVGEFLTREKCRIPLAHS